MSWKDWFPKEHLNVSPSEIIRTAIPVTKRLRANTEDELLSQLPNIEQKFDDWVVSQVDCVQLSGNLWECTVRFMEYNPRKLWGVTHA